MWLIQDVASVNQDWFESLSKEEQIQWVESQTVKGHVKQELKKKCNGKRETVIGEVKQAERNERKPSRKRNSVKKSADKGSED